MRLMPVKSAKREEIITVQLWRNVDAKMQTYALPIIRDHKKQVVDIGPAQGPTFNASWQIASFLKGCKDASRPDDEVFGKMDAAIRARVATMSPESKQILEAFMQAEGIDPKKYL
jgi:hypothetical protein